MSPDGAADWSRSSSPLVLELRAGVRALLPPLGTLLRPGRLLAALRRFPSRSLLDFSRSAARPSGAERADQQQAGGVFVQVS